MIGKTERETRNLRACFIPNQTDEDTRRQMREAGRERIKETTFSATTITRSEARLAFPLGGAAKN